MKHEKGQEKRSIASVNFQKNHFFNNPRARKVQPATKATPPTGVIAPNILISVIDSANKLPENKIIPTMSKHPDHLSHFDSI